MRLLAIILFILSLTACAPATDPDVTPAQHRQWANELISIHDLNGAVDEMRQSLGGNPNIADALLYADLLESRGKYKKARTVYKRALRYPADLQQKEALAYRLALLEAADFNNWGKAQKLAETLPPVDSRLFDVRAVILFQQKEYKKAQAEAQKALSQASDNEQKGWANFHLAQIYYAQKRERDTFGALFNAINTGRGFSLVERITTYWEARRHIRLNKE